MTQDPDLARSTGDAGPALDGPSARLYAEVTGMLARFSQAVEDQDLALPANRNETEQALRLALVAMTEAQKRIQRQEARIRELEDLSQTDELTGLANRRGFIEHLRKTLALAKRNDSGGLLLMIDLDRFKDVNDSHGHAAGDALLQSVAALLRDDVRETDTVARLGGDEFVVLMPELTAGDGAARSSTLAERLNAAAMDWHGALLPIRASVGVFAFNGDDEADAVLRSADAAMYRVKANRRGRAA